MKTLEERYCELILLMRKQYSDFTTEKAVDLLLLFGTNKKTITMLEQAVVNTPTEQEFLEELEKLESINK